MIRKFPRKMRLTRRRDFKTVFGRRCTVADRHLVMYIASNGLDVTRLGLTVGRKVGRAVVRNRTKRLIREAFRRQGLGNESPGHDVICIPKNADRAELRDYEQSLRRLLAAGVKKLQARN